jgi:hypothetical protein
MCAALWLSSCCRGGSIYNMCVYIHTCLLWHDNGASCAQVRQHCRQRRQELQAARVRCGCSVRLGGNDCLLLRLNFLMTATPLNSTGCGEYLMLPIPGFQKKLRRRAGAATPFLVFNRKWLLKSKAEAKRIPHLRDPLRYH